MADLVLSDGREIVFDLHKLSITEYRALFDKKQKPEEEDVIMCRIVGLGLEEYRSLPYPDWRRLIQKFIEVSREPVTDPNLPGVSTST